MKKEELNSKFRTIKINYKFLKFKKKLKENVIVQSLLFPKDKFSANSAKKWALKKGYKIDNIDIPKTGNFIHLTQNKGKFANFKTKILNNGIKLRIATNNASKFAGQLILKEFSKFSEIKSDLDMKIPMSVELQILCDGPNRDGLIRRKDLDESLERWGDIPIIDFHDKSKNPTEHKISDRKGYTFGKPYLKFINGKTWIIAPGEILNRDLAYQIYMREKRKKPLEISAEFGWNKSIINGEICQTNITPHMISIIEKGHIQGNKMAIV